MNVLVVFLYANSTPILQENCLCSTAMNFLSIALTVGSFSMGIEKYSPTRMTAT